MRWRSGAEAAASGEFASGSQDEGCEFGEISAQSDVQTRQYFHKTCALRAGRTLRAMVVRWNKSR